MIITGIDLGGQGAICSLFVSEDFVVEGFVFKDLAKKWNPYNAEPKELAKIHESMETMSNNIQSIEGTILVEDVKPYPGMSAKTCHPFSMNIGIVYGLLSLHKKDFMSILAKDWQSLLNLKTKSSDKEKHKEEIRDKLLLIYPEAEKFFYTERGRFLDGRSDALGIAHAGLISLKNGAK